MASGDDPSVPPPPAAGGRPEPASVTDDLSQAFGLLASAARKAAASLDPERLEHLGRRVASRAAETHFAERVAEVAERLPERVDALGARVKQALEDRSLEEFGRSARRALDAERLEQVTEQVGKEVKGAVERVVAGVGSVLGRGASAARPSEPPPQAPSVTPGPTADLEPEAPPRRYRIEE